MYGGTVWAIKNRTFYPGFGGSSPSGTHHQTSRLERIWKILALVDVPKPPNS